LSTRKDEHGKLSTEKDKHGKLSTGKISTRKVQHRKVEHEKGNYFRHGDNGQPGGNTGDFKISRLQKTSQDSKRFQEIST